MNSQVFRENDIRGRADTDIAIGEVSVLGQSLGTYLRQRGCVSVAVGRDERPSSAAWFRALSRGLMATGCDVVDVGLSTTPSLYYATNLLETDAGIMITASHNAADYNGLKVLLGREPLCGLELQEIRSIFEGGSFAPGSGRYEQSGVSKQYLATLRTQLKLRRRMRIGLDAGSSIASGLAEELLRSLGTEITCVRTSRAREDHRRVLDPARETDLRPLQETVIQNGLDLGLAFDSDGDRLGVVGPTGEVIRPDDVLLLFARELLQKHPRAAVVGEVMCSQNLFREIERLGGRPIMSKTGYSLVRRKMVESKALLGGEISGHFFFHNRFHSFSDALYAGGRLLTILAAEERSIVQLLADIPPTIATPRLYFPCADETKAAAMTSIAESLRGLAMRTGGTICEIDGVRIDWEAAWAVARMSNTEPAIVVRCEAADGGLDAIRTAVTGVVRQEVGRYAPPAEEGALRE